ncbi:MAG TPA: M20 family metallopeptidase [Casimicrobiaceae bacterium]|nr:M20 family metallopeptidase [Casimicrobiaceae bacterium]
MNNPATDAVALTRELIRFDTVNPPGQERRCAEYLAELLHGAGFEISLRELSPDRCNLIATPPRAPAGAPIVFTGHIDVVPLGTRAWKYEPFAAELIDGRVHGRGSSDMKSGVAAFVCAALQTARDATPPNVKLVITAGEETGCSGAAALVAEGGVGPAAAMVVGEPTANAVCAGHKGALWLTAVTTGVTAHGSMPERGVNAIYKAARVVGRLESYAFDAAPHAALGRATLSVNTIHGGININSVPDRTEIGIDIRTVPSVDHAALRQALQERVGDDARIEAFLDLPGIWTSPELDWVKRVTGIASEVTGAALTPGAATYFTDASVLAPAMGQPSTVILGPGEPGQAHQTDEWCSAARIGEAVDIYARIMRDWAHRHADR